MIIWMQQQGGIGLSGGVCFPNALQIHVHHRISIQDQKSFGELLQSGENRAGGAERLLLDDVTDFDAPPVSIREMRLDQVWPIADKHHDVLKSVQLRPFDLMLQQWFAANRN